MLFSVIVPVYKAEKYLRQCVDSILTQTFSDFELILVDDGSPDSCPTICDEYAMKDKRVVVIHKENGGSTSSRKSGLNVSKGKYIVAVDSDDFIDQSMLKTISEVLQEKDYDIVCFEYNTFPYTNRRLTSNYRIGGYDKEQIENEIYHTLITGENGNRFPPSIWGKAFKREIVFPILNDLPDKIVIGEDSCVSYVSVYLANSIYILNDKLYYYRIENQSLTRCIKRAFSWDEPFLRADFYFKYLPEEQFGDQVARITVHSLFNVASSVMKTKSYRDAKKEIKIELSKDRAQMVLKKAKFKKNKKEKLALYCLRRKKCFLMKMISRTV